MNRSHRATTNNPWPGENSYLECREHVLNVKTVQKRRKNPLMFGIVLHISLGLEVMTGELNTPHKYISGKCQASIRSDSHPGILL